MGLVLPVRDCEWCHRPIHTVVLLGADKRPTPDEMRNGPTPAWVRKVVMERSSTIDDPITFGPTGLVRCCLVCQAVVEALAASGRLKLF